MELKPYQQKVLSDLENFLLQLQRTHNVAEAFYDHWTSHPSTPLQPYAGTAIEPYKNNVPQVPHVCIKVPTAGGKTFIACNAIKTIFNAFDHDRSKVVVWLVPSVVILEQTLKSLKDPQHPYRQKINALFANRVAVYDKQTLLQGSSFNAGSVQGQLSIFVLSFDSLRSRSKEDKKVYQENSNLQSFRALVGEDEEISLMRVIRSLNPVLIVDESHNAESGLSVEMLRDLNPCFILDLTATPRKNSNIISFVDALELKKEHMVKLPVIVYNHHDRAEVISSALQLRRRLEVQALDEEKKGGRYIRPIVLFQAQPKNAADTTTFEKIKEKLIALKIPEEQIRIKTAKINEIKGLDLTSRNCPVRFIITVNALKEGWDCPFAYILASLADRSSAVDVEQILGRVLRQPYVMPHESHMLNVSYVLTASSRFFETLDNIVKALNKAGFSGKDFKVADIEAMRQAQHAEQMALMDAEMAPGEAEEDLEFDIDSTTAQQEFEGLTPALTQIEQQVLEQSYELQNTIVRAASSQSAALPAEIQPLVKVYRRKAAFEEHIALPQFYIQKPIGDIFNESEQLLSKEDLLEDFQLSKCDSNIVFNGVSSELYKVDLDISNRDYTPSFVKLDGKAKSLFMAHITNPAYKAYRVKNLTSRIMDQIGNLYPIAEHETKKYIHKILEDFSDEQYRDFAEHDYSYSARIKDKINSLASAHAEQTFHNYLATDRVLVKPSYVLPAEIIPGGTSKSIAKSLYEKEAKMDSGFEELVISEVAGLPNVLFWTRNIERRQFKINGFVNHYPDFIIYTNRHKIILLETKGDDRDNSDSEAKIRLGKAWESKAGSAFKYFMVFNKQQMPGAYRLDEFLKLLRDL